MNSNLITRKRTSTSYFINKHLSLQKTRKRKMPDNTDDHSAQTSTATSPLGGHSLTGQLESTALDRYIPQKRIFVSMCVELHLELLLYYNIFTKAVHTFETKNLVCFYVEKTQTKTFQPRLQLGMCYCSTRR